MACQIEIFMILFGALLIKADVSASDGYNEELFGYLILIIVYIPIVSALLFQIFDAGSPLVFAWWSDSTLRKEAGGTPVGFFKFATKTIFGANNEYANEDNLEPASKESKTEAEAEAPSSSSPTDLSGSFQGGAQQKKKPEEEGGFTTTSLLALKQGQKDLQRHQSSTEAVKFRLQILLQLLGRVDRLLVKSTARAVPRRGTVVLLNKSDARARAENGVLYAGRTAFAPGDHAEQAAATAVGGTAFTMPFDTSLRVLAQMLSIIAPSDTEDDTFEWIELPNNTSDNWLRQDLLLLATHLQARPRVTLATLCLFYSSNYYSFLAWPRGIPSFHPHQLLLDFFWPQKGH